MGEAVEWLARRTDDWTSAAVIYDSKSLLDALQGDEGESRLRKLREKLWELSDGGRDVTLVWVPPTTGSLAMRRRIGWRGLGCGVEQTGVELDGATRRAAIRRGIKGPNIHHKRLGEVYTREEEESAMQREDRTNLTSFRTGHRPKLSRWQVMVGRG